MSLKDLQAASASAAPTTTHANTSFGAVLRVVTAEEVDGGLKLTGTTLTNNSRLPSDSEVTVLFRNDTGKALSNFIKGHDKRVLQNPENAAGSFVLLESCYLNGEMDGDRQVISARWINTLAASGDTDHANRSFVENVYASAPRLAFDNPNPKPGEPKRITLPTNAKSITARVATDGQSADREFTREWAVGKLRELPASTKVAVTIDTIDPSDARKIGSRAELDDALRDQLGRGTKAIALIRISDSVNDVLTRLIYVPFKKEGSTYVPDVDKAMDELYARNIIRGIGNEALLSAIDSGGYTVEVVPGYRMTYAGDTTRDNNAAYKLVSDVKGGRADARSQVIFGDDPSRFAKVILGGIARNENVDGFSPVYVITDEPGTYAPYEIQTAHFAPRDAASRAPASVAEEGDAEPEPELPRP